jgi:polyphosphate kinase
MLLEKTNILEQHIQNNTMMNDDEKGKRLTETGNYADRSLNDVKLNSQEIFYAMAYSNAEKTQKKRED